MVRDVNKFFTQNLPYELSIINNSNLAASYDLNASGLHHNFVGGRWSGGPMPRTIALGGGVWIGPCRYHVLHHLPGFGTGFFEVFCMTGGLLGPEGGVCRCDGVGCSQALGFWDCLNH